MAADSDALAGRVPVARLSALAGVKGRRLAAAFSVAALYVVSRLPWLARPGLAYDEAIFIFRGRMVLFDWGRRYIAAEKGGKQPLHSWLVALSLSLYSDPVFAGRIVSVAAGALSALALWLLGRRVFSTRVATLGLLLYILCPFTLLFDRMALADSLLTAEALWVLYLGILLFDRPTLPAVLGMALAWGAALLTKSVGKGFLLLLAVVLLVNLKATSGRRLLRFAAALLAAAALGYLIYYAAFGASPYAAVAAEWERTHGHYTLSLAKLLGLPWPIWAENAQFVIETAVDLATLPLAVLMAVAVLASPRLGGWSRSLALWGMLPILGLIVIAATFHDRYFLFCIPVLLMLAARGLASAWTWFSARPAVAGRRLLGLPAASVLAAPLLMALLLPALERDYRLLTDVRTANHYSDGHYGLWAMADYLRQQANQGDTVYVIADDANGPIEDGTHLLLWNVPGIQVLRLHRSDKLSVYDVLTGQQYPKQFFAGRNVYYAHHQDAETDSWLDGRVELAAQFANEKGDDTFAGLYRIHFDDSFR